ncbi:hypothetical protein CRE_23435 [Caenorhabditis remanei]|uniref:DUF38 domain-containing protein n=1 Tax=Caenorhabditis remanei TaxID=31234 RepID=E3MGR6_CAERE|nr:hypothetical protein CRE_23435 [Caenorhabditis remanei]
MWAKVMKKTRQCLKKRKYPPILRSSDPPILRSSDPPILRSSDPPILRSSDPPILRSSDPPILRSSDPPILRSSDPPILRSCDPPILPPLHMTVCPSACPDVLVTKKKYEGNFRLQSGEETTHIVYRKVMNGCYVFINTTANRTKQTLFEGMDYKELLKKDLAVFLRHQKIILKEIWIEGKTADIDQVLNALKAHSENPRARKFPLKTNKLSLRGLAAPQLLLALSSVDTQSLCSLYISSQRRVLTDDITATEQWKNLDTCNISGFRVSDVGRISHVNNFRGCVTIVTAADIVYLKTVFLNSPNFSYCSFIYDSVASISDIATTFGVQPFARRYWFFRKPNDTSRVLHLKVTESDKLVEFGHKYTTDMPNDAEIIG